MTSDMVVFPDVRVVRVLGELTAEAFQVKRRSYATAFLFERAFNLKGGWALGAAQTRQPADDVPATFTRGPEPRTREWSNCW